MSKYIKYGEGIYPRSLLQGTGDPNECPECGGLGEVAFDFDPERLPMMVSCPRCRPWCPVCQRRRPVKHECR